MGRNEAREFYRGAHRRFWLRPKQKADDLLGHESAGLRLRVTSAGARAYVFESRLFGKTVRLTIGDPRTWDLAAARSEAARMKTLVNEGKDPRVLRAEQRVAYGAQQRKKPQQVVTMGEV
ncbi:Arm DNA-binding domain-containing protein [Burkholderia multivorans]